MTCFLFQDCRLNSELAVFLTTGLSLCHRRYSDYLMSGPKTLIFTIMHFSIGQPFVPVKHCHSEIYRWFQIRRQSATSWAPCETKRRKHTNMISFSFQDPTVSSTYLGERRSADGVTASQTSKFPFRIGSDLFLLKVANSIESFCLYIS